VSARVRNIDVAELPANVFGPRGPTWWGMMGFVLVETQMFLVAIGSYFYLRRNFEAYPPLGTPNPSLLVPTIGLVVLLASIWAAHRTDKASKEFDRRGTASGLTLQILFGIAVLGLRTWEGLEVHTRWDTDAYGSVVWLLLIFHTMHVLIDTVESGVMLKIIRRDDVEKKHFVDSNDGAIYWYYVALVWVPIYVIIYLVPRWI
jgi:cytochrome c oxidase subunit 3